MKRLSRNFFLQPTLKVARNLLGKYLIRVYQNKKIIGKIVETEAYIGPQDRASHTYNFRKTKRNAIEYEIGGQAYVYLVYGLHWQFNVVTAKKNKPECVLIRALEPVKNIKQTSNGPAKLCRALHINKSLYAQDMVKSRIFYFCQGAKVPKNGIIVKKRVGIDYAGHFWATKKWRFYIKNNPFVSKK